MKINEMIRLLIAYEEEGVTDLVLRVEDEGDGHIVESIDHETSEDMRSRLARNYESNSIYRRKFKTLDELYSHYEVQESKGSFLILS